MSKAASTTAGCRPRRFLLVCPPFTWPADYGGAQRTTLLYEALAKDADVDLFVLGGGISGTMRATLARRFRLAGCLHNRGILWRLVSLAVSRSVSRDLPAALPNRSAAIAIAKLVRDRNYDAVVLRYSATACQLFGLREKIPGVPLYVDVDDFLCRLLNESSIGRESSGKRKSPLASFMVAWIEQRERTVLLQADGLWVTGSLPSWLEQASPKTLVRLENLCFYDPGTPAPKSCRPAGAPVFLGVAQFSYAPNHEGFDWFVRLVWPKIRLALPNAVLRLVGQHPPEPALTRWRNTPGVIIAGKQTEIVSEYGRADVVIAPIFRGAGTKIKVVEALAMGLPCVCSPEAAAGLDVLPALQVTADPDEFAQQCKALAGDPALRLRLGGEGRGQVESHFSRAHFHRQVELLVNSPRDCGAAVGGVASDV